MCIICEKGQDKKEYKDIEIIDCYGCTSFTSIPVIDGLRELHCGGCTSLNTCYK